MTAMTTATPIERVQQLEDLILRCQRDAAAQADIAALTRRLLDEGLVGPGELMRMHSQAAASAPRE